MIQNKSGSSKICDYYFRNKPVIDLLKIQVFVTGQTKPEMQENSVRKIVSDYQIIVKKLVLWYQFTLKKLSYLLKIHEGHNM